MNQSQPLNITDELLSAFLDNELDASTMNAVRDAIAEDETLSDRLAELASVDQTLIDTYATIDEQPLPEAVTQLLDRASEKSGKVDNVVSISVWQTIRQSPQQLLAAAASFVVLCGLVFITMDKNFTPDPLQVALDEAASGEQVAVGENVEFVGRLTFKNREGDFCRQYALVGRDTQRESIACRSDVSNQWSTIVSMTVPRQSNTDYQTASGGSLLDGTLDTMIEGNVFSVEQEQVLINSQWTE